jgi:hypothetical protein
MQDPAETLVPLAGIFFIFGLPLTYAIVNRVLAHQERLEFLKRGIVPPPDPKWARRMGKAGWYDPNMYGMPQGAQPPQDYDAYCGSPARTLRKGITLAMVGLALFIGLSFINPGHFGPWLLGGLFPLFVGIAQIIIAVLSGASFGPAGPQQPWGPGPFTQSQQPPPTQQQPFTPKDVTPGGYAGWRPGPTTGLEKPPSPPDRR